MVVGTRLFIEFRALDFQLRKNFSIKSLVMLDFAATLPVVYLLDLGLMAIPATLKQARA